MWFRRRRERTVALTKDLIENPPPGSILLESGRLLLVDDGPDAERS